MRALQLNFTESACQFWLINVTLLFKCTILSAALIEAVHVAIYSISPQYHFLGYF